MIQIRGKKYEPKDYEALQKVLILGLKAFDCKEHLCSHCPHKMVCNDIDYVIEYCREKAKKGDC